MSALFEDYAAALKAAETLKIFSQPQRLMILSCLLHGERSVSEIAELTQITQPALSQQLAELRRAELVRTRRRARQVWYALASATTVSLVRNVESLFAGGEPILPPGEIARPKANARKGSAHFARILSSK